jgi:SulP family sulfate permease
MSRMASLDTTGAAVLRDTVRALEHRGITVLMSGVRPEHLSMLAGVGVDLGRAQEQLFTSTPAAIEHARRHVAGQRLAGQSERD